MSFSYLIPSQRSYSQGHGHRKNSFRRRCLTIVKQQKTRVYILRRCVTMLLCWRDHSVSDY
ncbi:small polypeptide DEVIL 10 [Spinacia oleracea]|uniref:Small polypeptide DEVIL 10 n=1 Tax=Spinacia oleracea TaxID=3562 RepID=A0A9R0K651_SPIOL|nr:small polypeptide DEVIL 10 [Spinacia oleracea]